MAGLAAAAAAPLHLMCNRNYNRSNLFGLAMIVIIGNKYIHMDTGYYYVLVEVCR